MAGWLTSTSMFVYTPDWIGVKGFHPWLLNGIKTVTLTRGVWNLSFIILCTVFMYSSHSNIQKKKKKKNEFLFSDCSTESGYYGFRGSPSAKVNSLTQSDSPHLAMTYSALASLLILGDDLSQIDKVGITSTLQRLQKADGR